jgi:dimethylargininase
VLALGAAVVVSAAAPRTAELIAGLGFDVHLANLGELHKGDGALTCLSLRFAPPGCWCA